MLRLVNKETGPLCKAVENADHLKDFVLDCWNIKDKTRDHFPAPQPVSLERKNMKNLLKYDYVACVKSDGVRYLLLCYQGSSYVCDRTFTFYSVNLNLADIDTRVLLDGELIINHDNEWQYIVHDCVYYNKNVANNTFVIRYSNIAKFLTKFTKEGSAFDITGKRFYPYSQLNLLNEMTVNYNTDGIVFIPKYKGVGMYTQYSMYKWKPGHLHTIDLKIEMNENGIMAYAGKSGKLVLYASVAKGTPEETEFVNTLSKNCPDFICGSIVECSYINETFVPLKVRPDKLFPNSIYTIEKTIINIQENITITELIELCYNC